VSKIIDPVVRDTATDVLSPSAMSALRDFEALSLDEGLEVWKTLPPPTPYTGLNGEYMGRFAARYVEEPSIHEWMMRGFKDESSPMGYWLRKCYKPLSTVVGEGYNVWRLPDGTISRRGRFSTHLGTSRFDGNLALIMSYASFRRTTLETWKGDTNDDVRQLEEGVYIGCAHARLDNSLRAGHPGLEALRAKGITFPGPDSIEHTVRTPGTIFVLTGPVGDYIGADDPASEDV
jgi:hypothetical protein